MKCTSIFFLIVLSLLSVRVPILYSSPPSTLISHLTSDEVQIVTKVAEANIANRERIHTFECLFERESNSRSYSGQFACAETKAYLKEINHDANQGIELIESDGRFWSNIISTTPPKLTRFEDITPDAHGKVLAGAPWSQMDGDIASHLLSMTSENSIARSVRNVTIDDSKFIVLELAWWSATDSPENYEYRKVCHFSVSKNYLPVKLECYTPTEQGDSILMYSKEVTKIESFGPVDQAIHIPVDFHAVYYRDGQQYRESTYQVKVGSIRINQALPDSLFAVTMDPCDVVIDAERGLQWRMPAEGVLRCKAPDFTLTSLDGDKVTLSKVKANVIVLDFWATWCGPCEKMLPVLNSLHNWAKENRKPVAFYGISDEKTDVVSSFLKKHDCNMHVLLDSEDRSTNKAYKCQGIPYVVIISNGIIQNTFIGAGGEPPVLEQHLKDMIISALEKNDS
jgi:thiol-disulfide isomerase/thioredoxin